MDTSYYSEEELQRLGFKSYGNNVLISRLSRIYNMEKVTIGDNVRIDDFTILTGEIQIGCFVHIAAYSALFGNAGIVLSDFSGVSASVNIYSSSDDYSGESLTNPTIPKKYQKVISKKVHIGRHAIIGAKSVILPGVLVGEGVAVGAMSMVNKDLEPWNIYCGVPAKLLKKRSKKLLDLERSLLNGAF